jgi:hypothetical protein
MAVPVNASIVAPFQTLEDPHIDWRHWKWRQHIAVCSLLPKSRCGFFRCRIPLVPQE